jgi:Coenzyme PQQ synthesis protein D (PqqD)
VRTAVVRNPNLAWREIEGEVVIISPQDSQVHELNETAGVLWKRADGATSLEQIVGEICAEFDVDEADARNDVNHLVAMLREKQLLLDSGAEES